MQGWPADRFRHLTIGQKFFVSFGVILTVLVLSLATLLLYLSHVNSYVDRHRRITVPAVITAAGMQQNLSRLRENVHTVLEHPAEAQGAESRHRIDTFRSHMNAALLDYSSNHAARTHPILFGMLVQHNRMDLADREDEAVTAITEGLKQIDRPAAQDLNHGLMQYDRAMNELERNIGTLIDVHRDIDVEMKIEGDRLVNEARFIVASVTALLAGLIISIYASMRRWIADPLRRLSITADRVAHHDLSAQFEQWPNRDEVGV